jgi:hypothetical protein
MDEMKFGSNKKSEDNPSVNDFTVTNLLTDKLVTPPPVTIPT